MTASPRAAAAAPRTSAPQASVRAQLDRLLAQRILVLEGAMGSLIQGSRLDKADFRGERFLDHPRDLKGDSDVLSLTRPDVIREIHEKYLAAGADIIETNTFTATAVSQAEYGLEAHCYDMNLASARLARAAVDAWNSKSPDRPRFVAGSIGPMNRTLSLS